MLNQDYLNGECFCDFYISEYPYVDKVNFIEYMIGDDLYDKSNITLFLKICVNNKLLDISNYDRCDTKDENMIKMKIKSEIREKTLKDIDKYLKLKTFF